MKVLADDARVVRHLVGKRAARGRRRHGLVAALAPLLGAQLQSVLEHLDGVRLRQCEDIATHRVAAADDGRRRRRLAGEVCGPVRAEVLPPRAVRENVAAVARQQPLCLGLGENAPRAALAACAALCHALRRVAVLGIPNRVALDKAELVARRPVDAPLPCLGAHDTDRLPRQIQRRDRGGRLHRPHLAVDRDALADHVVMKRGALERHLARVLVLARRCRTEARGFAHRRTRHKLDERRHGAERGLGRRRVQKHGKDVALPVVQLQMHWRRHVAVALIRRARVGETVQQLLA